MRSTAWILHRDTGHNTRCSAQPSERCTRLAQWPTAWPQIPSPLPKLTSTHIKATSTKPPLTCDRPTRCWDGTTGLLKPREKAVYESMSAKFVHGSKDH